MNGGEGQRLLSTRSRYERRRSMRRREPLGDANVCIYIYIYIYVYIYRLRQLSEHGFGEAPPHFTAPFVIIENFQVSKDDQDFINTKLYELKFKNYLSNFKIYLLKFVKSPSGAPYAGHIRSQQDATPRIHSPNGKETE